MHPLVPYTEQEIQQERQKIRNPFTDQWPNIFNFLTYFDSNDLFSAFPTISVFMFMYLSLFLITNMFICFIFCRKKDAGFKQKFYVKASIFLLIIIFFAVITLFICMIINDRHYSKIYCNYYAAISAIDEGSNNNLKYIGLD